MQFDVFPTDLDQHDHDNGTRGTNHMEWLFNALLQEIEHRTYSNLVSAE
ncbi:MAG: hypothetical protein Q6373_007295 [Candidatus Sigynarchaeota archaeon]